VLGGLGGPAVRRAAAAMAAVVAVGAGLLGGAEHLRVVGELRATRAEVDAVTGERGAAGATSVVATGEHLALRAGTVEADTQRLGRAAALDRTGTVLADRTAERDAARTDLGHRTEELATDRGSLQAVRLQGLAWGSLIADLRGCLAGVGHAVDGLGRRDRGQALDGLRLVSGTCARADAALTPDEPGVAAFPYDFADPFVLWTPSGWYGYSTNGGGGHVQLIHSPDLRRWEWLGEALPALPAWADRNRTWAPTVLPRPGGYVLYYAVRHRDSGHQCISVATSTRPGGPFVDTSTAPFVCQHELGGSIDPSPVLDALGRPYLLWKSEDETVGGRAGLWSAPLTDDGRGLAGFPVRLLTAERRWEGRTVEGPSMARVGTGFSLFYSGSSWNSSEYGIGHASCATPVGPCQRTSDGPVVSAVGRATGTGGPEPLWVDGRLHLAFHAWTAPDVGYSNRRKLHIRAVAFDPFGRPSILP
jgi:hypothetical protein